MSQLLATLVNGRAIHEISVLDRGLHYGDGVFETLAVASGAPLLWERHMRRLQAGAARLGIAPPPGTILKEWATSLIRSQDRVVLKIIVTRGIGGRGYRPVSASPTVTMLVYAWPGYPPDAHEGVAVRFCDVRLAHQPRLAGVKHLNRLEQVMARAEWREDFAEGLMLDYSGHVIEGTMSNLFAVIDDELRTPALGNCGVEGVMRNRVLETARSVWSCRITTIAREDLERASEIFLTNCLIGIWPITKLMNTPLAAGPVARYLQTALRDDYLAP